MSAFTLTSFGIKKGGDDILHKQSKVTDEPLCASFSAALFVSYSRGGVENEVQFLCHGWRTHDC